jgi:broad specificity phosphatase PhoE
MKLYLVRHGQTQANYDDLIMGWLDVELNEVGKKQAKTVATKFNESIDAIYTSDLLRCTQTAEHFREKYPSKPFSKDKRLRERCYGIAQGTKKSPYDWGEFWSTTDTVTIEGAETLNSFNERIIEFVTMLQEKYGPSSNLLIVAHSGSINRVLLLYGISDGYRPIGNCAIITAEI